MWMIAALALLGSLRAEWRQTETSLAWEGEGKIVWRFCFETERGKPYFQPVAVNGVDLTMFQPADHPWHYALWFSWKYINGVNYWEESRTTGGAEGRTRWAEPRMEKRSDGSALIVMKVDYVHPTGRVDLREERRIEVSKVEEGGAYTIDWSAEFVAGEEGAVLDRTPMPDEPEGKINGGYAGLSVRLAPPPLVVKMVTTEGAVEKFVQNRARPNAAAVAANFSREGTAVGGIAILADPANIGEKAPWYLIDAGVMRFMCAAVLAPAVKKLEPGEKWVLRYRIAVGPEEWTPENLRAARVEWLARKAEQRDVY